MNTQKTPWTEDKLYAAEAAGRRIANDFGLDATQLPEASCLFFWKTGEPIKIIYPAEPINLFEHKKPPISLATQIHYPPNCCPLEKQKVKEWERRCSATLHI